MTTKAKHIKVAGIEIEILKELHTWSFKSNNLNLELKGFKTKKAAIEAANNLFTNFNIINKNNDTNIQETQIQTDERLRESRAEDTSIGTTEQEFLDSDDELLLDCSRTSTEDNEFDEQTRLSGQTNTKAERGTKRKRNSFDEFEAALRAYEEISNRVADTSREIAEGSVELLGDAVRLGMQFSDDLRNGGAGIQEVFEKQKELEPTTIDVDVIST